MRIDTWRGRSARAALAIALAAGTVGAFALPGGSATAAPAAPAQTGDEAAWTVLIYADLDNNLEVVTIVDQLDPAADVTADPNVNVVSLIDRTEEDWGYGGQEDDDLGSIPNFGDAKLVTLGDGDYQVVEELGEVDMGDPQTLAWFVREGITQFPAEHYALYLSDHGGGFDGAMWDDSTPSADFEAAHLTVDEIGEGIAAGLEGTGVDSLDLMGFDACLMSTVEMATTLTDVADYMLASEEITFTSTVPYNELIEFLQDNPDSDGQDAGLFMLQRPAVTQYPTGNLALLDLSMVGALEQSLETLSDAFIENLDGIATEIGRQRSLSLEFGLDDSGDNMGFSAVDLGDFLSRLVDMPEEVDTARRATFQSIDNLVVEMARGSAASQATGLTIYFPGSDGFYFPEVYGEIDTGRRWKEFLDAYFDRATEPGGPDDPDDPNGPTGPPEFTSPDASLQIEDDGVLVFAELVPGTEGGVVDASFFGGVLQADSSVAHLLITPATIGAGDEFTIAAGWDFGYLQVTDGEVSLDATTLLTPVVDSLLGLIPLIYQGPDGNQIEAAIQFTLDEDGDFLEDPVLVAYPEDGGVAELQPEEGSLLAPLVLVSQPGGDSSFELLSNQAVDASVAEMAFTTLPAGSTFHVTLVAYDAADNTAVATGTGLVGGATAG